MGISEDLNLATLGENYCMKNLMHLNHCTCLYPSPVLESNLPVDVDSDHDYEYVDDLMIVIGKAQENAKFY